MAAKKKRATRASTSSRLPAGTLSPSALATGSQSPQATETAKYMETKILKCEATGQIATPQEAEEAQHSWLLQSPMIEDENCGKKFAGWDSDEDSESEGFLDDDMDFLPTGWGKDDKKSNEDEERAEMARKAKLRKAKAQTSAKIGSLTMKTTADITQVTNISMQEPDEASVGLQNLEVFKSRMSLVFAAESKPAALQSGKPVLRTTKPETPQVKDPNSTLIEELARKTQHLEIARAQAGSLRAEIVALKDAHKREMKKQLDELESQRKKEMRNLQNSLQKANSDGQRASVDLRKAQESHAAVQVELSDLKQKLNSETIKNNHLQTAINRAAIESTNDKVSLDRWIHRWIRLNDEGQAVSKNLEIAQTTLAEEREKSLQQLARINTLSQENMEVKKNRGRKEPLVKIGADIRLRFLEQAREAVLKIPRREVNNELRTEGNLAAHAACSAADSALFKCGFVPEEYETETTQIFKALYRGKEPNEIKDEVTTNGKLMDADATLAILGDFGRTSIQFENYLKSYEEVLALSGPYRISFPISKITPAMEEALENLKDATEELVSFERRRR
ncbi:hypothetical protein NHQ30_005596 [Ciborinia camelliae]|nr:hypothetical protein NHQ30_005596 [Ciborinia camelliae]